MRPEVWPTDTWVRLSNSGHFWYLIWRYRMIRSNILEHHGGVCQPASDSSWSRWSTSWCTPQWWQPPWSCSWFHGQHDCCHQSYLDHSRLDPWKWFVGQNVVYPPWNSASKWTIPDGAIIGWSYTMDSTTSWLQSSTLLSTGSQSLQVDEILQEMLLPATGLLVLPLLGQAPARRHTSQLWQ